MPKKMMPQDLDRYREQSSVYGAFNPEGRPHVVCPKCRALVLLCDSLSRSDRQQVARQAAANSAAAMETLRTMLPCGDREAKAIVSHFRKAGGGCHHCGTEMPRGALLCSHCLSVNLDWAL
jgi:hypothetical protein